METGRNCGERVRRATRPAAGTDGVESAAAAHGAMRQIAGFDLVQLVGEFGALRASVLALWRHRTADERADTSLDEVARFDAGIDEALAESVERYSLDVSTFLAVIAHDLRSPLWVIKGSSEILASPGLSDAKRDETMVRFHRAVDSTECLVSDLLEYSGAQLGRGITLRRIDCDLGLVCAGAVAAIRALYPDRRFTFDASGDLQLVADPHRLEQALSKLLHNAVRHGEEGSTVAVRATGTARAVVLDVANGGAPMPIAALRTIFDPIVRRPASRSEPHDHPYTGLGVGLFIVREIVHRHGGTVTIACAAETVFTVTLPREG